MKVLLIQSYARNQFPIFPIGLAYIVSAIKDEHEIQVLDMNVFRRPWEQLSEKMRSFRPDVVGISLRNIDSTEYTGCQSYLGDFAKTIKIIKGIDPAIKCIVGGSGFSIYAEQIMRKIDGIDIGVYLEGEQTFRELLTEIDNAIKVKGCFVKDNNGAIVFTGTRNFWQNKFLTPSYEFFDLKRYTSFRMGGIGIQTKRGCGFKCIYCPYPFLEGHKLRLREPSDVVDEIEFLVKNYGVRKFTFVDSVFNAPLPNAVAICKEIISRKLDISWAAYTTVKGFTEDYVRLAAQAGCVAFPFSVDAFSDKALKAMGKGYTNKDVLNAYEVGCRVKPIRVGFSFFLDPPETTVADFFNLVRFLLKVRREFKESFRRIFDVNRIRIEPNTPVFEIAVRKGLIKRDVDILKPVFYAEPKMRPISFVFDLIFFFISPLVRLRRFIHYRLRIKPSLAS